MPDDASDAMDLPLGGLRPRRRLRRPMVLTPLVDIVFLLLTFFMLSSQLTPFSLLSLEGGGSSAGAAPAGEADAPARPEALLSVGLGTVRLNGQALAPDALLAALRREASAGTTRVTILASADATVQDFVSALEAAKTAAIPSIAVADMR